MTAPSDQQQSAPARDAGPSGTQEIPVVPPTDAVRSTGPVDAVPAPPPAARPAVRRRTVHDRVALIALGLVVLSVVLLEVGLALRFGSEALWSTVTLWSAFATGCALLALLAFAAFYPAGNRLRSGPAWRVAAGGLVGLAVFWLLVVLPEVAGDRGFVLTAALGSLGAALWLGPRRRS